ncbi:MAG: aldehyde dehydrogenase [Chloroflexi bacterium]|nr:MAG: aldehyde dehydrogenase [Chloroflexota bacterium]
MKETVAKPSQLLMHVGGRWVGSAGGATFQSVSPVTGETLAVLPKADREDARAAVAAANSARPRIADMPVFDRARLCQRIAEALESRAPRMARELSMEQGKPVSEAESEIRFAAELYRDAGENVKRMETALIPSPDPSKRIFTLRQPHGVVAVLTPWNYPVGIPSEYLAASVASGNAVVWKPAPTTSLIAVRLLEAILEAGMPEGVVNLIFGDAEAGDEIVSNPGTHAVGFTGSSATGNLIAQRAGAKPVLLELGGNGPTIILDDADLEAAVKGTAFGCFSNAGQICQSSERILVSEHVHDDVLHGLVESARAIKVGNPLDPATTMGPLNNEGVAGKMDDHVRDAVATGASVAFGGRRAEGFPTPLYYEPTVIDGVKPGSLIDLEETFGPIAPLIPVKDMDEAIALANDCQLGLCAAVYTSSLRKAFHCAERLQCGVVNVNETPAYWDGRTPFGGYSGKGSGVGRLGGMATVHAMTQVKSVVLDLHNVRG